MRRDEEGTNVIELIDVPLSVCKVTDYSGIDIDQPKALRME